MQLEDYFEFVAVDNIRSRAKLIAIFEITLAS